MVFARDSRGRADQQIRLCPGGKIWDAFNVPYLSSSIEPLALWRSLYSPEKTSAFAFEMPQAPGLFLPFFAIKRRLLKVRKDFIGGLSESYSIARYSKSTLLPDGLSYTEPFRPLDGQWSLCGLE